MATFSKGTFNATLYAAARPSYPPQLYQHVLSYAFPSSSTSSSSPTPFSSTPKTLLDLGCGPGLSTFQFQNDFDSVIGLDPSSNMIKAAKNLLEERKMRGDGITTQTRFEVGFGEDLSSAFGGGKGEVDLVVAGQAAHWFNAPKVYKEIRRILKPGGSFVFWGYGEFFFPQHEKLTKLIPPYSGGVLEPYWEQPGRSIVEDLLRPFPFPSNTSSSLESSSEIKSYGEWDTSSFHRDFFDDLPNSTGKGGESHHPLLLKHQWNLNSIESYLNTFSAAHSYREKNPSSKGGKDVVETFIKKLRNGMKEEGINVEEGEKIEVGWKVGMIMGKKAL